MSPAESNDYARTLNEINAKRTSRADAAAGFVVALIGGIALACALLHFLSPCSNGGLC